MKPQIIRSNFEEMAQDMITKRNHADYMRHILDGYRAYRQFMSQAFLDASNDRIFRIRATYRRQKKLWREMEVFGTQTLADLASSIVESMGWIEDHLHGFWFPDERRNRIFGEYGIFHKDVEDDPYPQFKTKDVPISQINWNKYPVMGFVFDFGDGHEFDITVQKTRKKEKSDCRAHFPRLTDQRGIAPEQYPPSEGSYEEGNNTGSAENFLFDDCAICQAQKNALVRGESLSSEKLGSMFEKSGKEKSKSSNNV